MANDKTSDLPSNLAELQAELVALKERVQRLESPPDTAQLDLTFGTGTTELTWFRPRFVPILPAEAGAESALDAKEEDWRVTAEERRPGSARLCFDLVVVNRSPAVKAEDVRVTIVPSLPRGIELFAKDVTSPGARFEQYAERIGIGSRRWPHALGVGKRLVVPAMLVSDPDTKDSVVVLDADISSRNAPVRRVRLRLSIRTTQHGSN